ncbi:thioredoxin family protein [Coriobacteriia bacterium Es71-Z0120]|uniref:thioredoxin family protein n=1 Tax=Parvivirga hydrogeniphila TaxID=2939460 RepID=UPI002260A608|nr:thioredoxin family protein [Parvivirga hydrogeniphila]MCL4078122.1 thioredoxin family protein [Parvivirga hydrogeniphila]
MSTKADNTEGGQEAAPASAAGTRVVLLAIVVVFAALVVWKLAGGGTPTSVSATAPTGGGASLTSTRNDAVADFDRAIASGKPIFVLFHSLTCQPCIEISAVADKVVPEYRDRIAFVNAITDDSSGAQLANRFAFQYIPTSFFLSPGATSVIDSYTGTMSESEMRARLDALLAKAK